MNKSRQLAGVLLLRYQIVRPSLDDVIYIIRDYGYDIIDFDPDEHDSRELILKELNLDEAVLNQPAFLYSNKDIRILFLREMLSVEEKKYAVAHELGHIVLDHMNSADTSLNEYAANEFVHYFLNPHWLLQLIVLIKRRKRIVLLISFIILIAILSCVFILRNSDNVGYSNYFVTEKGTKYHVKECIIIHDKKNVRQLSKEELLSGYYEPCGICLGGSQTP